MAATENHVRIPVVPGSTGPAPPTTTAYPPPAPASPL